MAQDVILGTDSLDAGKNKINDDFAENFAAIAALNNSQGVQDGKISALETSQGTQDGKISALETSQGTQDGKITALETSQGTQDGKITALEQADILQDESISSLEVAQGNQAQEIAILDATVTNLDIQLAATEVRVETLEDDAGGWFIKKETSVATLTPDFNQYDLYAISQQAQTLVIANPTPKTLRRYENRKLLRIIASGSQLITWGTQYVGIGVVLPTTLVDGDITYFEMFPYNDIEWHVVAIYTSTAPLPPVGSGFEIDIVSGLRKDMQNILRDNLLKEFEIITPVDYVPTWEIVESTTQTLITGGSTFNCSFTPKYNQEDEPGFSALPTFVKEYDLIITATKASLVYRRRFRKIFKVLPAAFTEAQADEVWDISTSIPYKNGGYIDRPGYKIFIKGNYTGGNYIAFQQYRSSNPKNPIVMQFSDVAKVTINTSSAYMIQANFDCQNLIIDGAANPNEDYGFTGKFTGTGSQGVRIQPADTSAGSTLTTAGYNFALVGIEVNGDRKGGSGFNVSFDPVGNATINYDNWSFLGFSMSNCRAYNTTDEGFYIGRFNDSLVSGYAKPSLTGVSISYNIVDTSGGDAMQYGICFDGDISNNLGINLNWRNATDHRNLFQFNGGRNNYFYQNKLYNNTNEGGSTLWNIETGRGGTSFHIFSNLLVNKFTGSHANGVTIIEQNAFDDIIENAEIYNNTIILYNENSIEIWRRTTSVTTVLNPFRIVDNAILNINDPDAVVYINSPNTSGFTISNLFNQVPAFFGFTDYDNNDFRPASLDSELWAPRTPFTKTHPCANEDADGYQFSDDIQGCYSGVPLLIQGRLPDTTPPSLSGYTIRNSQKDRIYFDSSEVITGSDITGFNTADPQRTILSLTINPGQLTGHYFTVDTPYVIEDTGAQIFYVGGSDIKDTSNSMLQAFSATQIINEISPPSTSIDLKVNFFTGVAAGWVPTGSVSPKGSGNDPVDYGNIGQGIGLRALNPVGNTWNATGASGTSSGNESGIYPDAVMLTYWYMSGAGIATFEFYNAVGTPFVGQSFTITLFGSRAAITQRFMRARVNGGAWSNNLDVANNISNVITFTDVIDVGGVITIDVDAVADDFAYINGLTLISD